jgi:hypothetical protein
MAVRERLAADARAALETACPGSRTHLRGSLATGTADAYSDIDLEWVVPDAQFTRCVAGARTALDRVRQVADVRSDPDFHRSQRRRLLFVLFEGVSLFWRLDLSVRAESIAHEADFDAHNPAARATEGEWSRPASALANALGAVKAVARGREDEARGLLERGFARIGERYGARGPWSDDVALLAGAAADQEPALTATAEQVAALAAALGKPDPTDPTPSGGRTGAADA